MHDFLSLSPVELAHHLNQLRSGLDEALDIRMLSVGPERVVAEMHAGAQHLQPYGLVHGGTYCAFAESVCSAGANMVTLQRGEFAVGIENRTRFVAAARAGAVLRVVAEPRRVEGRNHTWAAEIRDGERLCAEGEVVVRAIAAERAVGGEALSFKALEPAETKQG